MNSSPRAVATTLVQPQERIDSLSDNFIIMQPDGHGYRYSTDDMLVAWFALLLLKNRNVNRFIDLGSGLGSVPMILLACLPQLQGVGVEVLAEKVSLFKRSLKANRLETRFAISHGDLRNFSPSEPYNSVPLISTSPPYFSKDAGVVPTDKMRAVSMFELHGDIGDYIAFAARHLSDDGLFVTVYPTNFLHKIKLHTTNYHLNIIAETTIIPSEKKESAISLIALSRSTAHNLFSAVPKTLTIRSKTGKYTEEYLQARKVCHFL
jgi:tRNA1(Val) A37 N6-methylase TrmN6